MIQNVGLGKLKPNILVLGFKDDWQTAPLTSVEEYTNAIHDAFDYNYSVAILRLPKGTHLEEDSDWEGECSDEGESSLDPQLHNTAVSSDMPKSSETGLDEAIQSTVGTDGETETDTPVSTPMILRDCEKGLLLEEESVVSSKQKNPETQKKHKEQLMPPLTEKRKGE